MIKTLRRLHEEATAGLWEVDGFLDVATVNADDELRTLAGMEGDKKEANAALIAAMRNALPMLLNVADEAESVCSGNNSPAIMRLRAALDRLASGGE